jgi:hypothetical protein
MQVMKNLQADILLGKANGKSEGKDKVVLVPN